MPGESECPGRRPPGAWGSMTVRLEDEHLRHYLPFFLKLYYCRFLSRRAQERTRMAGLRDNVVQVHTSEVPVEPEPLHPLNRL